MRWLLGLAALALLVVFAPVIGEYQLYLLTLAMVWAVMALGMGLLLGYLGELNFGQVGFVAIAAYASALLRMKAGLDFWSAALVALPLVALAAVGVGLVTLRVRGPFFALVMLAFGEIVRLVIANWQDLTNGPLGLRPIPPPDPVFGVAFDTKLSFYYLVLAVLAFVVVAMARLVRSRTGYMFRAIREDPLLAEFIGVHLLRYKLIGLVVSALIAGLAGLLLGPFLTVLSPSQFTIFASVDMLVMVVVGGNGTIAGPLIGAVFLTYVPEALTFAEDYRPLMMGGLLIVLTIFMPSGVVGEIAQLGRRWRRWRRARRTGAARPAPTADR